jgi:hypothetical protein
VGLQPQRHLIGALPTDPPSGGRFSRQWHTFIYILVDEEIDIKNSFAGRNLLLQVKIIDFNVVGGSTHPLLFTWEELSYQLNSPTEPADPEKGDRDASAAVQQNNLAEGNSINPAQNPSHASQPAERDSTSQQSRQGDVPAVAAYPNPSTDSEATLWRDQGDVGPGELEEGVECSTGIEFRIVTEPNRVQPNMPMFGVPYDLVDNSEGGAYSDLLQKLQDQQLRQDAEE